ncbi:hypothetical protein [Streptomyces cavernicola]|uniref:Uncharacterized protein n=1 Tax=Streptomyces cavernicola TaxID=3043613 RepID=A0ABT6SJD2_9ACTN|nr:hypothetical protein [Streptomyces sp. B-S-A6]MDI3408301.1 hypothetical protein [Streptomyces sp. B-S-A6]
MMEMENTAAQLPALVVREVTPDQIPTPPDQAEARRYLDSKGAYEAGRLHAQAWAYQMVVLDVRRGELSFHCDDWRAPRQANRSYPPTGGLFAPFHWLTVPDVIWWVLDAGLNVEERPYLTCEQANDFLNRIAPLAEALLLNLAAVPGTDGFDWTAEAASAGRDITAACDRHQLPPVGRRPELVNMHEAVSVFPQLVQDRWASLDDVHLDEVAEDLNRFGLDHNPAIAEGLGLSLSEPDVALIGTRAWLYENRRKALGDRQTMPAAEFLRTHPGLVTDETSDAQLDTALQNAEQAAAAEGVTLLSATRGTVREVRDELRKQVLAEVDSYGAALKAAKDEVARHRSGLYSRLYRVLAWDDQRPTDTELAKRAQMSRQNVAKLYEHNEKDN